MPELQMKNIIKFYRKKAKFSQQQVADKLEISQASYANYEKGIIKPSLENIVKLADLFDTTTDILLCRTYSEYLKSCIEAGNEMGEKAADEIKRKRANKKEKET